ncbi:hypothetical protein BC940DRAFT_245278 [Gongronella butleri]|nr:hypothetical protein BC940DRAFT_245278 [Gongronella butleri]
MRSITVSDLEQKSQRLPQDTTLAIETAELPPDLVPSNLSSEEAADFLEPSLRILTYHSNLKPHLDNGMNQNGIYYNVDYYRLYLAFVQFQKAFGILFPHEVVKIRKIPLPPSSMSATVSAMSERDRDRDRNMNMKAYRAWIEPLLTETNWAAFRRNLVVGERMVLLTKVVGQGVLLMTKELSGSKLHLTFTNSEWDEFIGGLHLGKWDATIQWDQEHDTTPCLRENGSKSRLVDELKFKFLSECWFHTDGSIVAPPIRKQIIDQRKQQAQLQWQLQENQENISPPASSPPNANNSANSSSSAASASSASSPPSTSAKQTTPSPPAISPSTDITPPAGQITTAP